MTRTSREIAIIGGGAAGLVSAKSAIEAGHRVTIFEIGSQLGGIWIYNNDNGRSSAYRSLHINTAREATHFVDYGFRAAPTMFPSHEQVGAYLNDYADQFDLRRHVRFGAEVTAVVPVTSDDPAAPLRWHVTAGDGFTGWFDSVIVATGHLTEPSLPSLFDGFTGNLIHSHYYKEPWEYRGKKVLVVGSGNSAVDIAADLATVADTTHIAIRSPELITPKIFLGRPLSQVEGWFRKPWLPRDTYLLVRRLVTRLVHGRMETWGIQTPKGRTHPISQATLIQHIAYERVQVRRGVVAAAGDTVTFSDGAEDRYDAIIAATGYTLSFPFLDPRIVSLDAGGSLNLFGRGIPPRWPGLYFNGFFNTNGLSNPRMMEHQSRWFAAIESGELVLPTVGDMEAEVAATAQWLARRYPPGPRYAFELEPGPYLALLRREQRDSARRRAASRLSADRLTVNRGVEERLERNHPALQHADPSKPQQDPSTSKAATSPP
ncbi:flavin-containing monooxygenase [Microbacterium soli]|uniref:NAD(P)-binding domain-containing protein n=1 Tax=Microbacterium soli TaxID=446075 RepID=A0ABP7MNG7_9MICO